MAITYFEKERIFKLDTPDSSYVIGIVDKENFVGHVYYGKKLRDANIAYLLRTGQIPDTLLICYLCDQASCLKFFINSHDLFSS